MLAWIVENIWLPLGIGIIAGIISGLILFRIHNKRKSSLKKTKYRKILTRLKKKYKKGDKDSANILGYIYLHPDEFGDYVNRDTTAAHRYYKDAYVLGKSSEDSEKYYSYFLAFCYNYMFIAELPDLILYGYEKKYSYAIKLITQLAKTEVIPAASNDELVSLYAVVDKSEQIRILNKLYVWNFIKSYKSTKPCTTYSNTNEKLVSNGTTSVLPSINSPIPVTYYNYSLFRKLPAVAIPPHSLSLSSLFE